MKTVIACFDIDGFHHYPDAPQPVDFLAARHRHTFRIKAGFQVEGLNREKEIFLAREELKSYLIEYYGSPCEFDSMSCEMIAEELFQFGNEDGLIWVEVWEEETGGARVEK
jgi:hypothetical protein